MFLSCCCILTITGGLKRDKKGVQFDMPPEDNMRHADREAREAGGPYVDVGTTERSGSEGEDESTDNETRQRRRRRRREQARRQQQEEHEQEHARFGGDNANDEPRRRHQATVATPTEGDRTPAHFAPSTPLPYTRPRRGMENRSDSTEDIPARFDEQGRPVPEPSRESLAESISEMFSHAGSRILSSLHGREGDGRGRDARGDANEDNADGAGERRR